MIYYILTLCYCCYLFARADNAAGGLILFLLWAGWTLARIVRERLRKAD